jgi:DNA-binding IclR family transcriptional regulator
MKLPESPTTSVGVLDRAMAILRAIEGGARTQSEVARRTGLPRPTVHRLLKAMNSHGLVASVGGRGYRLGPTLPGLAATAMGELPLRDIAQPVLERLARTTGESAQLFVRDHHRRVCIAAAESRSELRTIVEIGARLPLTAGSAGKVFLAFGPPASTAELLPTAERFTPATPVGERLERQLAAIRRRGWASSVGEREPGVASVSAPVPGPSGALLAVVSLSGPEHRVGRTSAKRLAPTVVDSAREIERSLGA